MSQTTLAKPLIEFNPKISDISKNESKVLKLLIEAAKLIVPVYEQQENREFPGANLYPHDATKEEIEKAAENDPEILSPYTVVERKDNQLVAIPYHIKYADLLKPVIEKIKEAAGLTDNKDLAIILKSQADALADDKYEDATISRFTHRQRDIDISIGSIDRYDDQLFFIKTSYQGWVGFIDQEMTNRLDMYKKIVLSTDRNSAPGTERVDHGGKVEVIVQDVFVFSGQMARTTFIGLNYAVTPRILEEYGSEIVLFKQANDLRLSEQVLPMFNKVFSSEFKKTFTEDDIKRGNLAYVALHELAHSYLHYKNAQRDFKDLYFIIEELAANSLGFRIGGSLLLKDVVNVKQLESMIISFLCRSMYLAENIKSQNKMYSYMLGGKVFMNYIIESGAIRNVNDLTIPNFPKIFVAIHDLSIILEKILSNSNRREAELFINKYTKLD